MQPRYPYAFVGSRYWSDPQHRSQHRSPSECYSFTVAWAPPVTSECYSFTIRVLQLIIGAHHRPHRIGSLAIINAPVNAPTKAPRHHFPYGIVPSPPFPQFNALATELNITLRGNSREVFLC